MENKIKIYLNFIIKSIIGLLLVIFSDFLLYYLNNNIFNNKSLKLDIFYNKHFIYTRYSIYFFIIFLLNILDYHYKNNEKIEKNRKKINLAIFVLMPIFSDLISILVNKLCDFNFKPSRFVSTSFIRLINFYITIFIIYYIFTKNQLNIESIFEY